MKNAAAKKFTRATLTRLVAPVAARFGLSVSESGKYATIGDGTERGVSAEESAAMASVSAELAAALSGYSVDVRNSFTCVRLDWSGVTPSASRALNLD